MGCTRCTTRVSSDNHPVVASWVSSGCDIGLRTEINVIMFGRRYWSRFEYLGHDIAGPPEGHRSFSSSTVWTPEPCVWGQISIPNVCLQDISWQLCRNYATNSSILVFSGKFTCSVKLTLNYSLGKWWNDNFGQAWSGKALSSLLFPSSLSLLSRYMFSFPFKFRWNNFIIMPCKENQEGVWMSTC